MKPEGENPVQVVREALKDSTPEEEAPVEKESIKEQRHDRRVEVLTQVMHLHGKHCRNILKRGVNRHL